MILESFSCSTMVKSRLTRPSLFMIFNVSASELIARLARRKHVCSLCVRVPFMSTLSSVWRTPFCSRIKEHISSDMVPAIWAKIYKQSKSVFHSKLQSSLVTKVITCFETGSSILLYFSMT